jgi:hypothetical protein
MCARRFLSGILPATIELAIGEAIRRREFFALVDGAVVAWPHDFIFTNVKEN